MNARIIRNAPEMVAIGERPSRSGWLVVWSVYRTWCRCTDRVDPVQPIGC